MVFSIARNFLRDDGTAEELAQEVFLDLYEHLPELSSPVHIVNWLRTVTTRRCIDYGRSPANRPKLALEDVPEPSVAPESSDPFLSRTVQALLASLPEKQRMVVVLRYGEDLDPAEISKLLEMPLNTVKSYLQRSLTMLREKMERMEVR